MLRIVIAAIAALWWTRPALASPGAGDAINAVIGDASWLARFGRLPAATDGEDARIATHRAFVRDHLRTRDVSRLAPAQRGRRAAALDALDAYVRRGVFPRRAGAADTDPGRRPRFIDDAGTHCAVGYLIARSGAPALAAELDAAYELAYVADMASPALHAWADASGFTTGELAMIQPAYRPPPSEQSTRRYLARATLPLALECAQEHPPLARFEVIVTGDRRGAAKVTTASEEPFARCFAARASKLERGGDAYSPMPQPYQFATTIELPPLQALIERQLGQLALTAEDTGCLPRPGPIPRSATITVTSSPRGPTTEVITAPANTAVTACLRAYVDERLRGLERGAGGIAARVTHPLEPAVTEARLRQVVQDAGPDAGSACYPAIAPPAQVTITVTAHRDAGGFGVRVEPGGQAFRACVARGLDASLRAAFTARRREASDAPFFRIDGAATVTHTFRLETPAQRTRSSELLDTLDDDEP